MDRVVETRQADGTYAKVIFNNRGQIVRTELRNISSFVESSTNFTYDEMGLKSRTTDQFHDDTYYEYDGLDRLIKEREPDTSFAGDEAQNQTGNKITTYRYDAAGNLIAIDGPLGKRTTYNDFDALGRSRYVFEEATQSPAIETRYTFDDANRTTRVQNEAFDYTVFQYDGFQRVIREGINIADPANPNPAEWRSFEYDVSGNLAKLTDRDNRVTTYAYDNLNRRVSEISKDPAGEFSSKTEYAFDKYGNLNAARTYLYAEGNWSKQTDYKYENYDSRGRPGRVTQTISAFGVTQSVQFAYTYEDRLAANDRRDSSARSQLTVNVTSGSTVYYKNTYQFDVAGREVFASQDATDTAADKSIVRRYLSTDGVRSEKLTRRAGLDPEGTKLSVTNTIFEAEDSHLVSRVEHNRPTGPFPLTIDDYTLTHEYKYDALDRLRRYADRANHNDDKVIFDPSPNPTYQAEVPYSRITATISAQAESIQYDLEGHVKSFTKPGWDADDYTFTWGVGDRLRKILHEPNILTDNVTEFAYDALGQLIAKKSPDGTVETYFYDNGKEVLRFSDNDGYDKPAARSFNSMNGELLAIDDLDPTGGVVTYWTLNDAQRSVRDLMTNDGTLSKVDYDSHGVPTAETLAAVPATVLRYRGNMYVAELKGYYNGAVWTTSLLDGRTLTADSTTGSDLYGAADRKETAPPSSVFYDAFQGIKKSWNEADGIDVFHGLVSAAGFIPGYGAAFDIANAIVYAVEGRKEEAVMSVISAAPGVGDAVGLAYKSLKVGSKVAKVADAAHDASKIGTSMQQIRRAVALGVASDTGEQLAGMSLGVQQEFQWERTFGAAISAGLLGPLTVGIGRGFGASANPLKRTAFMGAGSGVANFLGDSVVQAGAIYSGRQQGWDPFQSALSFAGGALGGALGQSAFDKSCFVAGTPLLWEFGHKPIEEFQVGERVYARDELNPDAPLELKPIEEIFVRRGFVTELIVAGRTIGTTAEHPFFVHGRGWTAAGELHTGDLLAAADGRWLPVESRYNTGRYENVYNFRVAEHHTYFVQGDDWEFGVWAHNTYGDARDYMPNEANWRRKGGDVIHNDGGRGFTTFIRKDGVSVTYNRQGHPDFSPHALAIVNIGKQHPDRYYDYIAANNELGLGGVGARSPFEGMTWHHHEDGIHMMLVPSSIHDVRLGGFSHAGGVSGL